MVDLTSNVRVVKEWIDTLNKGDIEFLIQLSDEQLEVGGPRGSAKGASLLREWSERTHLTFDLQSMVACGQEVIATGTARYHDADGSEKEVIENSSMLMKVSDDNKLLKLFRYDTGKSDAIAASENPNENEWTDVDI